MIRSSKATLLEIKIRGDFQLLDNFSKGAKSRHQLHFIQIKLFNKTFEGFLNKWTLAKFTHFIIK